MPITYDPDTNTIMVVGGTEDNPYTFEDIYNADQANGWGVFTKLSEGVYKTTAKLQFGDGATETWFAEKGTVLIIDHVATKDWDTVVLFKANCNAQFGEESLINLDSVVYKGVTFLFYDTVYGNSIIDHKEGSNVKYYGCRFVELSGSKMFRVHNYIKELNTCFIDTYLFNPKNTNIYNVTVAGVNGHVSSPENCIIKGLIIKTQMAYGIWIVNKNINIVNADITTTDRLASVYRLQSPNVVKFINCKPYNWKVKWYLASGQVSGELQRIYACKFKITDVDGNPLPSRTIKVYDKNGNIIAEVITDENGLTDETEILYAKLVNPYADDTWHEFGDEDWEYFNPFTVEVWYANELEYKGILTDLDVESTFIQITAKPSSFTLDDIYNLQDKIRKYLTNRWKIENNQLIVYDDDGVTPILTFDLFDKAGQPTEVNVYERKPKT